MNLAHIIRRVDIPALIPLVVEGLVAGDPRPNIAPLAFVMDKRKENTDSEEQIKQRENRYLS